MMAPKKCEIAGFQWVVSSSSHVFRGPKGGVRVWRLSLCFPVYSIQSSTGNLLIAIPWKRIQMHVLIFPWGYPFIAGWLKKWNIRLKWMLWRYPYFRNPPYRVSKLAWETRTPQMLCQWSQVQQCAEKATEACHVFKTENRLKIHGFHGLYMKKTLYNCIYIYNPQSSMPKSVNFH